MVCPPGLPYTLTLEYSALYHTDRYVLFPPEEDLLRPSALSAESRLLLGICARCLAVLFAIACVAPISLCFLVSWA